MNFVQKIINRFNNSSDKYAGHSLREVNPYGFFDHFQSDAYASAYPNIRVISNEYMQIRPFAIDANGKEVQNNAVINALYHPNQQDSSVSFAEKVAVSTLVNKNTYLLVWSKENGVAVPGGNFGFKGQNIAGFTFLEHPSINVIDKKTYYNIGSQRFSEDVVIRLPGGVDPNNLYSGYSPSIAAKKWATLDEYIADYQMGFFDNNAIPAGMFVITAPTATEFKDIVAAMKEKHQGAGNNNKVSYVHRPTDTTNKPVDAKIEWIQFAQSQKDIDYKSVFEQANKRLDLAFGVSQIAKGVDDAATYANAQVSEKGLAKRAVYPLALRNYTQITHELNRITGGLGIAITFKYDIPTVADEEKVEAETKAIETTALLQLVNAGYSLDSSVDALRLSNAYKVLKAGTGAATINNDKPDVDDGGEVEDTPDPKEIDGQMPIKSKAKPKAELTDEEKMARVARNLMKDQVKKAVAAVDEAQEVADQEDLNDFVDDSYTILSKILVDVGEDEYAKGVELLIELSLSTENATEFHLTDEQVQAYRSYLNNVGLSYSEDTTQSIRAILDRGNAEGWTKAEIKKQLNAIPELEGYRAERIARTETVKANGYGSLYSMDQIQNQTGYDINKVWQVNSSDPCKYCQTMDGKRFPVKQAFIPYGASIMAEDGSILVNNFMDIDVAQAHPNCRCSMFYEVVQ